MIKKIVIASGKGGTGKTTIAVNLAHYLSSYENKKITLLDCDVETPNDNIFINASFSEFMSVTVQRPIWNKSACISCGKCSSVCNYNAIAKVKDQILIFKELCHSCGACAYLCTSNALKMRQVAIGKIEIASNQRPFSFGHGILNIGESLAPMIIKKLKEKMNNDAINIIDASPGTTCPVVKSMEDMDYCLLVTEPTPFGLNDLHLATSLSSKMKIPTGIIINRSYGEDKIIENFAKTHNIPIVGKIPFRKKYAISYSKGEILINSHPELKEVFSKIYKHILKDQKIPINTEIKDQEINKLIDVFKNTQKKPSSEYKEIVVISGKGGTGKTTITSALSELMDNKVLADSDVDASNLHILCKPTILQSVDFVGGRTYFIDKNKCIGCGACNKICHFDAIKLSDANDNKYEINETSCEGCGFCSHICNANAISSKDRISGKWYLSKTKQGYLSHAKLGIKEENSGKLVSLVRDNANKLAFYYNADKILFDGPPGIGCPVISAVTGVDLALIITEPTLSGIHDMKRALDLTKHFNIKTLIVINKSDLNINMTSKIIKIATKYKIKVIGKIPFDKFVNDALMNGESIITYGEGIAYQSILRLWNNLKDELEVL